MIRSLGLFLVFLASSIVLSSPVQAEKCINENIRLVERIIYPVTRFKEEHQRALNIDGKSQYAFLLMTKEQEAAGKYILTYAPNPEAEELLKLAFTSGAEVCIPRGGELIPIRQDAQESEITLYGLNARFVTVIQKKISHIEPSSKSEAPSEGHESRDTGAYHQDDGVL